MNSIAWDRIPGTSKNWSQFEMGLSIQSLSSEVPAFGRLIGSRYRREKRVGGLANTPGIRATIRPCLFPDLQQTVSQAGYSGTGLRTQPTVQVILLCIERWTI